MRALKDNAPVVIIAALTILSFLGIVYLANRAEDESQRSQVVDQNSLLAEGTHMRGEATASATLVEFSDFQCPACGSFYPVVKSLLSQFPDRLRIAYKHYPLPQHPFARLAAEASEAAAEQGKFWEFHDLLFENQASLNEEKIKSLASELGLDLTLFNEALDGGKFAEAVQDDVELGESLSVNSTPTFYLNGRKLNLRNVSELEEEVKRAVESGPQP